MNHDTECRDHDHGPDACSCICHEDQRREEITPMTTATERAAELGADAGVAAAYWYEITKENATAILRGMADGDPAVYDTFPTAPLSGQWADDPLPRDILLEVGADLAQLAPEDEDDILRAYEDAYSEAAGDEIERRARIHYTGEHVVGSINCLCDDMSSHTPSITYPAP